MSGELEPNDSRNVNGTASTPDGHWTAEGRQPPLANGQSPQSPAQQSEASQEPTRAQNDSGMSGGGMSSESAMSEDIGAGGLSNEGMGESGGAMGEQMGGEPSEMAGQIREHMAVVDAEGTQVGTVDSVIDDQIKLTRSGSSDGQHHYLAIGRVAGIEGDTVRLHDAGESVFSSNDS